MNLPVSLGTYHGHRAFVRARRIADPAGCGDTYRARVIHAGLDHREWETTERKGCQADRAEVDAEP